MKKNIAVLGAGGFLGGHVVTELVKKGFGVWGSVRTQEAEEKVSKLGAHPVRIDVTKNIAETFGSLVFDDLVYTVGHCPPAGFSKAINQPLSEIPMGMYEREIKAHQIGVLNVFQGFLPRLQFGGSMVFISSAITRFKYDWPEFLQAHYYASVISAGDWLLAGMRMDPLVREKQIRIHRIAPAAIDSPFHIGSKSPDLVPVEIVVQEILLAMDSTDYVDKEILKAPAS